MSEIFISHATADKRLAELLVNFLKEAIGVPTSAIFCSSVKGHDIPLGEDFNDYIKQSIQNPKLVILLMTPAYVESLFCLMELGAAWAQSATSSCGRRAPHRVSNCHQDARSKAGLEDHGQERPHRFEKPCTKGDSEP